MRASSFQTYLNIPGASSNVLEPPPKAIVFWAISNNIDVLKQKILTYLLIFKIGILQAGEMAPLVKFLLIHIENRKWWLLSVTSALQRGWEQKQVNSWSSLASLSSPVDEIQVQ